MISFNTKVDGYREKYRVSRKGKKGKRGRPEEDTDATQAVTVEVLYKLPICIITHKMALVKSFRNGYET